MSERTEAGNFVGIEPQTLTDQASENFRSFLRNALRNRIVRYVMAAVLTVVALLLIAYIALRIALINLGPPPLAKIAHFRPSTTDRSALIARNGTSAPKPMAIALDPNEVDQRYLAMLFTFEDRRFYSHYGIDPVGLVRAVRDLVVSQRIITGGSTLTMQVARLLDNKYKRTASVKTQQILRAIQLEMTLTKREILSLYLGLAPFGGRIKGVQEASQKLFGKEPKSLTISEAALLVALPQAPEARRLDRHAKAARRARNFVLKTVAAAGVITPEEARIAALEPLAAESSQMPPMPLPKPSPNVASLFAGLTLGINFVATPAIAAPIEPPKSNYFVGSERQIVLDVRKQLHEQRADDATQEDRNALWMFYSARDKPLWTTRQGWTRGAEAAIDELKRAGDWGLDAAEFDIPQLSPAMAEQMDANQLAAAEVGLSLAILKYARHARGGRIEDPATQLSSYLDRKPQLKPPYLVISDIAASGVPDIFLQKLHPQHQQFQRLRQQYLALREGDKTATVSIPAKGNVMRPGTTHDDIALVRERLGVPLRGGDPYFYDDELVEAVKKYQERKGVSPANGTITWRTRRAFNESPKVTAQALLANMEEWRWMPDDLGDTHVWVNVPDYKVQVVHNGNVVHEERVVVGTTSTQTPIFSHDIETIYFHPRWTVPPSIKMQTVYPSLQRGGGYFYSNGLKLIRNGKVVNPSKVNWSRSDIRNYDIYQPPGPSNVLGKVKFTFPNKHAVYLHDTPSKSLFNSSQRTFSHGCIRVRNPVTLAEVLLQYDKGWDADTVQALLKGTPEENGVQLEHHIPVHITYFTASVDENGDVQTAKDVYGHEKRISLALAGKWKDIDKGRDHLAPATVARSQERPSSANSSSSSRQAASGNRATSKRRTASRGSAGSSRARSSGGGGGYTTRVSGSSGSANDVFRGSFGR
ncbi:transglycosylase domain-containing protein [Hyphomicrobium sulfonivorans]|uniref:transglycosylase domain-containing protein n=1 Tax=Hyphomicrobium sulfonivorans TaxID=121290 RepID=UPI00157006D5|nr:transglycosylase domain-containing protein [Hyphomicrobium sulfonivorans]MBI1650929.1 transglycosylase domain-containing protein [Hyphomicrobium sulfonivorans]NSL72688.1 hypothetical protein [Hyphomicrobium sulfonivorans]